MHPLSVGASIIAVAGALSAVSQKLIAFAKTLAHAAREVTYIAKEMNFFSTLLRALRNILEQVTPLVSQALDPFKTCMDVVEQAEENVGDFDKFLANLEPLRNSKDANLIARTVARLRWAFQKSDLLFLRSKLDSSKSTLNLYITTIHTRIAIEQLRAARQKTKRDKKKN